MTPDVMVNIDDLNRLLSVDKVNNRVTVEAGMSLHKLHEVLAENGLAMRNLGSISDQSVAGIMSTATHGTGANFGCLSTMVQTNFNFFPYRVRLALSLFFFILLDFGLYTDYRRWKHTARLCQRKYRGVPCRTLRSGCARRYCPCHARRRTRLSS